MYPLFEVVSQCFGLFYPLFEVLSQCFGLFYPLFEVLSQCFGLLYPLFEVLLCLFGYAGLVVRRLNLSAKPISVKTSIHSHIFLDNKNL